jgi:hypothetical protein
MLRGIYENDDFLTRVFSAYGVPFHVNGHVNCHNCRLCGAEQPPEVSVYVRDNPKRNVWFGSLYDRVEGLLSFCKIHRYG